MVPTTNFEINHMLNARLICRLFSRRVQCFATMSACEPPSAPLLIILGSTGTGKSEVSETRSLCCLELQGLSNVHSLL